MIQNNTLCEMAQAVLWIYPVKSVSILKLEEKLAIIKVKEGGDFHGSCSVRNRFAFNQ